MSVIAIQPGDKSNFLCKQFAAEASSMFDKPDDAQTIAARVPLENLFRVLDMFQSRNFIDETRRGVLALELTGNPEAAVGQEEPWHKQIESAVTASIHETYGDAVPEKEAAVELQRALRWLATKKDIENRDQVISRAKRFFSSLSNAL